MNRPEFYVGSYNRSVDDKGRVALPAQFGLKENDIVYFKEICGEIRCFDERNFAKHSSSLNANDFIEYHYAAVQQEHRVNFNGCLKSGLEVVVEGKGIYFSVSEKNK